VTTAIIGTGGLGSVIARQLASGGEPLRLASADHESARKLAAEIGTGAVIDRPGLIASPPAAAPRRRTRVPGARTA